MKFAIISTSPRQDSSSVKIARHLQNLLTAQKHEVGFFSFEGVSFPSVGTEWLTPETLNDQQKELVEILKSAERVIWVIPEYNRDVPVEFTGFTHQFGNDKFQDVWVPKIHYGVGVSSGMGGRDPIYHMWKTINYILAKFSDGKSFTSPYYLHSTRTGEQFDEQGKYIGNEKYDGWVQDFVRQVTLAN